MRAVTDKNEYGLPDLPTDLTHTGDYHTAPDYTLQMLADFGNRWEEGVALTLVVAGGLITGTVESRHAFLQGCAEKVRGFDAEGDENVQKGIDRFANDIFEAQAKSVEKARDETIEAERELGEGEDTDPPTVVRTYMNRHIHLSDTYWIAGGAPAIAMGHVRVLLSQVSAWSVGRP